MFLSVSAPEQAEGIALFDGNGGDARSILVVYDAAKNRQRDERTVEADLFALAD
ncbi:MAG: DUF3616 domain-containing protein [Candidatus Competibacteraceae bacterium]|nr:DUF3616 domain-containing protein [Candidatus Competibacteraceae bacterium]